MRHAFDADHIAAIDNTTRKLVGEGTRSLSAGFWFSPRVRTRLARRQPVHRLADMLAILLLLAANLFMTVAWYGHLKFQTWPLWSVIFLSWLIALPEYALQVPGNRIGAKIFTPSQLLIFREIISIGVSLAFFAVYLRSTPRWNEWLAFGLIVSAVIVAQLGGRDPHASPSTESPAAASAPPGPPI